MKRVVLSIRHFSSFSHCNTAFVTDSDLKIGPLSPIVQGFVKANGIHLTERLNGAAIFAIRRKISLGWRYDNSKMDITLAEDSSPEDLRMISYVHRHLLKRADGIIAETMLMIEQSTGLFRHHDKHLPVSNSLHQNDKYEKRKLAYAAFYSPCFCFL